MLDSFPKKYQPSIFNWARLGISILCGLAGGLFLVFQASLLTQVIAQVFLARAGWATVSGQMLLLLAVLAIRAILAFGSESSARFAAIEIKSTLRLGLTEKLLQLGPAYTTQERSGELVNTLVEGVEALDAYYSQFLPQLALAALVPLATLCFVFPIDLLTGIIFLVTAPLIPLFLWLIGNLSESTTRKQWAVLSQLSAHFLDILQGLTTLKQLGRSREQAVEIEEVSQRYRQATLGVLRVAFLSALALELIATLSTAIVAVEISLRLLAGRLDFQPALFILVLAPEVYAPLRTLGTRFHAGSAGIAAGRRIAEIFEQKPLPEPLQPASMPAMPAEIRFEGVSYTYPGTDQAALKDVNFSISPGKRVALVGLSGAGKTTISRLLLKFIQPQSGRITVGGIDLSNISSSTWHEQVAWLPQNPYLFNDTLAGNISLAKPDCTLSDMEKACNHAALDDFVSSLPQGYQTLIGEGGARLSGGEAQRLALARAFLKDAPLLILDEPASALDPVLEDHFLNILDELSRGRTTLVIAHQLSTAARADQVVVLEGGQIVQAGLPSQLAEHESPYQRLLIAAQGRPL